MSSGHSHKGYSLSSKELEEALAHPDLADELMQPFEINTECDMAYTAGYSTDGKTRYVDRHLCEPGEPVGILRIDGKLVNVLPFLVGDPESDDPIARGGHEGIEKAIEDRMGRSYSYSHEVATGGERRLVLGAGIKWDAYQRRLAPFIKADEHEKLVRVPADLDLKPFLQPPVDRRLLVHVREAMHRSAGRHEDKRAKTDVDYSAGMAQRHCGPVERWPTGDCVNYEPPNGCSKVRGFIQPEKWCRLWAAAPSSSRGSRRT